MFRVALTIGGIFLGGMAQSEAISILLKEHILAEAAGSIPDGADILLTGIPEYENAIQLQTFWMEGSSGQFVADVLLDTGSVQRVSGFAIATMRVPVPSRQVMPGEILSSSDLSIVEVPVARIARFALTDTDTLVGMEVKRMLAKGRPVMSQSVIPPRVVQRGERVKIIFKDQGLNLVAAGKALGDAARGEEVKVVNLTSNRSVFGIATADGNVEISN